MAKTITIVNGTASSELINGNYTVTSNVTGYENTSINPTSISVDDETLDYDFTISANGTLTLHVTEDGTTTGTPIVGASFVRTDSLGNQYGLAIISDDNGNAIFNNVPYSETNAPNVYFKQTASDGNHNFDNTVKTTTLTTQTQTNQIENTLGETRTISLTDASYTNLPIENGTITLNN